MRDQNQSAKYVLAYAPTTTTDNTAIALAEVDRAGFDFLELIWISGTIADADVTFVTALTESDTAGSGHTAIAAADLVGTSSDFTPLLGSDSKTGKIAYKGSKRYVDGTITPSNNSGNIPFAAVWRLSGPKSLPQSTQIV